MMRSTCGRVVCLSLLVGFQRVLAAPTDSPTDQSTEAPTDAPPTPAPPTPTPVNSNNSSNEPDETPAPTPAPVEVQFTATLELKQGFDTFDESAVQSKMEDHFPKGSEVNVTVEYRSTVTYAFAENVTDTQAKTGIANQCSVKESQVAVTIGNNGGRLLGVESSARALQASTSVDAVITSSSKSEASAVFTAAGNASGIASAMAAATGKNITEPTVTPPKASVTMKTIVKASAVLTNSTAVSTIAQSVNLKETVETLVNATMTVSDVQVITASPTAAPAPPPTTAAATTTGAPAPTTTVTGGTPASTTKAATTTAASNANGTTAAQQTTKAGGKSETTETESLATKCGIQMIVSLVALVLPRVF